ncbi:kelch-like protein 10, partial [Rhipicephalus sanguineus]|uniref:kelch-like protein 10 n=1 Tax=Rhipicephalus sanguineus TaxID=34632 RepID=UPI0020C24E59
MREMLLCKLTQIQMSLYNNVLCRGLSIGTRTPFANWTHAFPVQSLTTKSLSVGEVAGIDLSHRMWLTPRIPKHIIFVFGGWTDGATNRMITYNYRATRWRSMGNQYTSPRSYHGVAVINQCIYVVGGFNGRECFHSVVCFEVPLARWSAKANMAYPRCYVSVVYLEGHIYAMGGYDGNSRIKTAERYNVKKNNWTEIASMNEYRSDASAAVARGRIYIAGGYTGFSVLDTVEFYDPSTDVWTHMQSMPWRRSGHKLLAYGDMIYIIGGSNGVARVSTLQQLDVQKHRYSELPSMPHAKSNFAAAILEGCIYIIGGFNGTTTVSLVEKYDIAPVSGTRCLRWATESAHVLRQVVEDVANP